MMSRDNFSYKFEDTINFRKKKFWPQQQHFEFRTEKSKWISAQSIAP